MSLELINMLCSLLDFMPCGSLILKLYQHLALLPCDVFADTFVSTSDPKVSSVSNFNLRAEEKKNVIKSG